MAHGENGPMMQIVMKASCVYNWSFVSRGICTRRALHSTSLGPLYRLVSLRRPLSGTSLNV